MKTKLQQGDYVKNLTKEQFEELIRIENKKVILTYKASVSKAIHYDGLMLLHGIGTTELSFSEFKKRLINTIQHAN